MAIGNMEKYQDKMKQLEKQMEVLERNARYSVEDLRIGIEREADSLHKGIANLLRSKAFSDKVYIWQERDCARPDKDWAKVSSEAYERISSRVSTEISQWERNNSIVKNIKETIVKKFKRDFELMEDQIQQIEGKFKN